ncbi:MAG TPA: aldo/keto reductase [Puia sp.]|nr:aldo/keto reductase [Puia sp.]
MQYSEVHGYTLSKLTLGTVALGLDYGISNDKAKPGRKDSFDILSRALDLGINTLDTASSYGNAEQLIGDLLQDRLLPHQRINIVTKFKISAANVSNKERLRKEVYDSLRSSLGYLRLQRVPFCLFHMDRNLPMDEVLKVLPSILSDLKHDGLIDIGGVSADHPGEVGSFLEYPVVEAIQVPMNIFDLRLIKSGMLERMHASDKIVFVRSVFLQGLFFMPPDGLKGNLAGAAAYIRILQKLAKEANMSIAQLAFSYIRDLSGISSIVFGAVNAQQVEQNIELLQGNAVNAEVGESIRSLFDNVPEHIITPGLWSYK